MALFALPPRLGPPSHLSPQVAPLWTQAEGLSQMLYPACLPDGPALRTCPARAPTSAQTFRRWPLTGTGASLFAGAAQAPASPHLEGVGVGTRRGWGVQSGSPRAVQLLPLLRIHVKSFNYLSTTAEGSLFILCGVWFCPDLRTCI